MERNGLKSLDGFNVLSSLRVLRLDGNRILDISDLERLNGLLLSECSLQQNPVSRKPTYRISLVHYVPTLETIDGLFVSDEERSKALVRFHYSTSL